MILKIHLILIFTSIVSLPSISASFNCNSKKLNNAEQQVCTNASLSILDDELGQWYSLLKNQNLNRLFQVKFPKLKEKQIEWLKYRNSCKDINCIESTYQTQLDNLKKQFFNHKKKTSKKYLKKILSKAYNLDIEKTHGPEIVIDEVLFYSIYMGVRAEYLFKASESLGIGSGYCGAGRENSYVYIKYNFNTSKIEEKIRMIASDCGAGPIEFTHRVEDQGYGSLSVITSFEEDTEQDPIIKDAFKVNIGNVDNLEYSFTKSVIELSKYPDKGANEY